MSNSKTNKMERKFAPQTQDNSIVRMRLSAGGSLTSSVAGIINTVLVAGNPSTSPEWASCTNLYDEFRVVGTRLRLISKQQFSVTAINDAAVVAFDDDNTTALVSVVDGCSYNTSHLFPAIWAHTIVKENTDNTLTFSWMRPTAGKNTSVVWYDTATPANSPGGIKFYCSNITATTQYFTYVLDWYVEFRGRS